MQCALLPPEVDVVCLYGVENFSEKFLEWLDEKKERCFLILEDREISFVAPHLQVRLFFLPKDSEETVLKQILWEYLFLKFYYISPKNEKGSTLFEKMQRLQEGVHLIASDWCDLKLTVVKNVLRNFDKMPVALRGKDLFGKFQNVPAVICGSGPSLTKNVEQLKELQENALIFAGGTALSLLSQHEINIHFAAAIDPNPPEERFTVLKDQKVPFLYQNRVDQKILEKVTSPLLWFPDCGSSILERYMFGEETFDGGWNVATFCSAVAQAMGCNPIIFVGMDLAAEGKQIYAAGAVPTEQETKLIEVKNEEGISFYSKRDWMMARSWLENLAKKHSETQFFNATEGGIGIPGIENKPLSTIRQLHLQKKENLYGKILSILDELNPIGSKEQFELIVKEIVDSFKEIHKLCIAFLKRAEEIFPTPLSNDGTIVVILFELEEEIAYKAILSTIWQIWQPVLLRENSAFPELQKILLFKRILEDLHAV